MSEWMNEWMDKWMNESMNERLNEQKTIEWINKVREKTVVIKSKPHGWV